MSEDLNTLNNIFFVLLLLSAAWIFYAIFSLISNFIFFKKIGENKWLGLIPLVNDYVLFKHFWDVKYYVGYLVSDVLFLILSQFESGRLMVILSCISNVALFVFSVMLMDKIRKRFGKGLGYLFGLVIVYPVFALLLSRKEEKEIETNTQETYFSS